MSNSPANTGLSNPFSTSGGGGTFEQLVGTSYLVSLLVGEIPRGVDWGTIKEVKFQHRWSGCLLDDIVVTSTDGDTERKLALQVKHELTFSDSDSNKEFTRVMDDCWKTFNSSLEWEFNQETDRLGIGIGVYQTKVDRHLRPLLEWARTSKDSSEFLRKVSTVSSEQKRKYLEIFRNLLSKSKGSDVTDDEIWKFLRCLVVIHFDLEKDGSRDSIYCWNRLLDQLKNRDEGQAELFFNTLTSIVAKHARSAGSIDASTLRAKIPSSITLKGHLNFTLDIARLREHTDRVLGSIPDTIGGKVQLPRTELLELIETSIKEKEVAAITGEPMMGKSVLLKLLANRLRSEGEIIALSVERLSGTTAENFLHNMHIKNDFQSILFAMGTAPLRCILIDGLERVRGDEDRRRVLNDLIIEVSEYNKSVLAKGGHQDNCWKIVFACRELDTTDVLRHLETRKNLADNSLKMVKVRSLSDDEVVEVVDQLPQLKELASQGHLKEILSFPLVLDILTLPDISLPSEGIPPVLTETWLLDWFWEEVVRLGDGLRPGKGKPDTRERLLVRIARQSVGGDDFITVSDDMDFEAVSGLVSDRLIIREDNHIRFAHDVYEDWALALLLKHNNRDIPGFLTKIGEPLRLVRAFRLYASRLLEVKQSPETWLNLLAALEGKHTHSPRWYQIALTAPLFSPLLNKILPRIQPCLLENDAALLSKFLKALRTICVQPSPMAYTAFGDLPPAELEKYLAYWTIPIWKQWAPVIQLVLQNPGVINDRVAFEFSHIAEKWMTNTEKDQLFRKEIANISLKILDDGLLQSYEDEPRNRYIKSVIWAADCLPDQIDDFVKQKALRNRENGNYGFEELILNEGWIPLCKHLPKTAVELLESILCEKLEPDRFGSYHHLFMDLGIGFIRWHPPTYFKGPFLGLLRLHSDEGLELIHRVANHATRCWKMREELDFGKGRKPIPQMIRLKNGAIEVWGDEPVFYWYRYPSVAPDAITCSLMALEYWMNEQLKNGADPQELFERVLQDTESVAVVGVCSSVALANEKACREAVIPILENPTVWMMDIYRLTQDLRGESSVNMFSTHFSLGNDKADYKILLDLAIQPHRKFDIRSFVLPLLLFGSENARQRLQNAIRSFPDNPPFLYEDEKGDDSIVHERIETCKIWAAQAERENYEAVETEVEGEIGIQFKLPVELEEEQKEKLEPVEELNKLLGLQVWSMNLLEKGAVSQAFTIQSAMESAQDLVCQDDSSYQPTDFLLEQRVNVIAAFAAALVTHQWQWVENNDCASWCREQLLIAAKRPEPPARFHDEVSRNSMGYRRSAARALPILLLKYPEDRRIREAISALALHRNDEVRDFLFNGLKALWMTDQKTIWVCIDVAIKSARRKAVDHKFWYLKEQPRVTVVWGKHVGIKKVNEQIKKTTHSFLDRFYPKPIRNCSPTEIDSRHLQSILYCLPSNIQITEVPSSNKLVDFLEELLLFTINAYVHFEKEGKRYNEWDHNDWNLLFFPIIANALLRLPQNVAEPKLFDPIVNNWEQSPAMMKELLQGFGWVEPQPELEDRFIELWLDVGDRVLASAHNNILEYHLNDGMREILGLLIFVSPTGTVWDVREWKPLKKMTPFVSRWCDTVGHHPDCFSNLVRLLKEGGFDLVPEFGIGWLYNCIRKADDHKNFFERSRTTGSLAELLHDSWSKQEPSIKQNPERLKHFVFIVDKVAEQGESIAIRLQYRLQESLCDE